MTYKEQQFTSHHPEGWEVQDQGSRRYMVTSCCVLTWWMEPGSPLRPLLWGHYSHSSEQSPLHLIVSPKFHLLYHHLGGEDFSLWNQRWRRDKNIWTVTVFTLKPRLYVIGFFSPILFHSKNFTLSIWNHHELQGNWWSIFLCYLNID